MTDTPTQRLTQTIADGLDLPVEHHATGEIILLDRAGIQFGIRFDSIHSFKPNYVRAELVIPDEDDWLTTGYGLKRHKDKRAEGWISDFLKPATLERYTENARTYADKLIGGLTSEAEPSAGAKSLALRLMQFFDSVAILPAKNRQIIHVNSISTGLSGNFTLRGELVQFEASPFPTEETYVEEFCEALTGPGGVKW